MEAVDDFVWPSFDKRFFNNNTEKEETRFTNVYIMIYFFYIYGTGPLGDQFYIKLKRSSPLKYINF